MQRCSWVNLNSPLYVKYHDEEWGEPVHSDDKHFEFLILESFQAGLSWSTILNKRENFRKAFDNFDVLKVAKYSEKKFQELINNAGIIRNKLKIRAAINNAKSFLEVQKEFGTFDKYSWQFVGGNPIVNHFKTNSEVPETTKESDTFSSDLKKRGFKFVGSTVIYAHMQAIGMVNDHIQSCFKYKR